MKPNACSLKKEKKQSEVETSSQTARKKGQTQITPGMKKGDYRPYRY